MGEHTIAFSPGGGTLEECGANFHANSALRITPSTAVPLVHTPAVPSSGDASSSLAKAPSASSSSAVTRSWSDLNHLKLMATFGAGSLFYSAAGQPFFVAIARQQSSNSRISALQVFKDAVRRDGWRSLFRGTGLAVTGTVVSELLYYGCLEYGKEKLPFSSLEWRSFGAGLLAELSSTLVFNPFAVVSQLQMVAGPVATAACPYAYASARRTGFVLVREHGWRSLFRGSLVSLAVAPVVGGWWYVYEALKRRAYDLAPILFENYMPTRMHAALPHWCTSTSDNALINSVVGASTNILFCVVMNPIYVLRLRVQTTPSSDPRPFQSAIKGMLAKEGPRALWKGLSINMLLAALGGFTFGFAYEGTKLISDTSAFSNEEEK